MSHLPEPHDIWYPKGQSKGTYVVVTSCEDDHVEFLRHDEGQPDHSQRVRLSTFLSRFDQSGYALAAG
jgi:hypothetical protein